MAFDVGTIDGIARQLGGDVLFLALLDEEDKSCDIYADIEPVINWLGAVGIGSRLCTAFEPNVVFIEGGPGCIYLEIDPDGDEEERRLIEGKFGPLGGPALFPGFRLSCLSLADAMLNAEQDDEKFWDNYV